MKHLFFTFFAIFSCLVFRGLERRDGFHRNHRRFIACLLEEEPGRVVGTGMLAENSWKGKHSLSRIAVEEGFRLRGAGSAMRERMEGEARKMGLKEIIAFCYEGVLGFWAKAGYYLAENIGREPGDKEDSYMVVKKL